MLQVKVYKKDSVFREKPELKSIVSYIRRNSNQFLCKDHFKNVKILFRYIPEIDEMECVVQTCCDNHKRRIEKRLERMFLEKELI